MSVKNHLTHVLLIDDDEEDCSFFREAMSEVSPSVAVSCLKDAGRLMEAIENTKPSVIFIDFKMPGKNGIDCVRQLKAHPAFKTIPVIMWSTSSICSHVAAAYKAGVQLYMEKPWDLRILSDKLKNIIRQIRLALFPDAVPYEAVCGL